MHHLDLALELWASLSLVVDRPDLVCLARPCCGSNSLGLRHRGDLDGTAYLVDAGHTERRGMVEVVTKIEY